MKTRIEELAALEAVGALDGAELQEFQQLLHESDSAAAEQLAKFRDTAALLAIATARPVDPSAKLKDQILKRIAASCQLQTADGAVSGETTGFKFIAAADVGGWINLRVPGASIKLLSLDHERGYAVILGKLAPGTHYPEHQHLRSEQIFVIAGDLHIGEHRLGTGDFHHADAGTRHGINRSEAGCTILAVISTEDLQAQMA